MRVIHYGATQFDKDKFKLIVNGGFVKPSGGLWVSPKVSLFAWKDWCEVENFRTCDLDNSFEFDLKSDKIARVNSLRDLLNLPLYDLKIGPTWKKQYIDFEKCATMYDAIHLTNDGQIATRFSEPDLYGWDCESILILNPEVIPLTINAEVHSKLTTI